MTRISLFIAALAVAIAPACKRDRTAEPESTAKTAEPTPAAAEDEAEEALETAREAKETADSALETARAAQAAAAATAGVDDGSWWSRKLAATPETSQPDAPARGLDEADRISVAGRVTESAADRLVIAPVVGAPMAVRVNAETRVEVDGQTSSAAALAPGTEVRVLYRLDGITSPTRGHIC